MLLLFLNSYTASSASGRGYFGKFDEDAVKNNFVLVYELLDGIEPFFLVYLALPPPLKQSRVLTNTT